MANEALERTWLRVRDELRRQRGQSRYRGSEVHLLPKREIRLPVEFRGSQIRNSEVVIHLHEVEAELWAIQQPEGQRVHISEFNYDLGAWLARLLEICRGEAYLRTEADRAKYRDAFGSKKELE